MNKVKLMRNIYCYIDRCFKDAYKMEDRDYDKTTYSIDFILFKSKEDEKYVFCPVFRCKYKRVITRVMYRLNHNLEKNFGVVCDENTLGVNNHVARIGYDQIDPNHTQAFFKLCNVKKDTFITFDIFDEFTDSCFNGKEMQGDYIFAKRYETLVFTYWDITGEVWEGLSEDDERRHLPADVLYNPGPFKELYKKAFNEDIGCRYDFMYTKGLKKI